MSKEINNIVLSAMSGDKDAYGKLYEFYANDMYRFALGLCKNTYDAQDAVQETAVSVFKSMHSLRNPEKFKSYLFLSLSNTCKKILSKNNYIVEFEDTGYTDSEIEFFVHGALCVCYSGDCRLSEFIDGIQPPGHSRTQAPHLRQRGSPEYISSYSSSASVKINANL